MFTNNSWKILESNSTSIYLHSISTNLERSLHTWFLHVLHHHATTVSCHRVHGAWGNHSCIPDKSSSQTTHYYFTLSGIHTEGGEPWDIHPQTLDLPPPQTPEEIFEISSNFNLVLLKKATLQLLPTPPCPLPPPLSGKSCMNPWVTQYQLTWRDPSTHGSCSPPTTLFSCHRVEIGLEAFHTINNFFPEKCFRVKLQKFI